MDKKRILVVASCANSLINFRGDYIQRLISEGYDVYTAVDSYPEKVLSKLKEYGVKAPLEYYLQRTGLNPFNDLKTIFNLKKLIKENNIDLVFPYTVKPVIYGSLAANMAKVPVVSLITGLGFTFTGLTLKSKVLQRLNEFLYKISIRKNKVVVFQNNDDRSLFFDRHILTKKNKTQVVSGSGVNLDQFTFRPNHNSNGITSFIIVTRLIREKGTHLFIEAAKVLKQKYPNTEFHVIGSVQNSPSAIKVEELQSLHENGTLVFHGSQSNVLQHLTKQDVFVLPTFYREGVPRSILEALSVGLPIITTDSPGCRETVLEGENGFLIPPQNLEALIKAMEFFITNPKRLTEMGLKSREYAEKRFDVDIINQDLIDIINSVIKK
ncbi:MAG: glycosyltransferase family 4 protein [Algibacter sp.]|uniref:glycosyltransferase family 4 protein n=1 Tax=Algibacter sp. TaxID=1872428 RepID=UPI002602465B|nr:glycosyltransferase family 4 protein [Algibacter sp.]MDG1730914.1 glycosyltransferase family 4 protein [Algibacter sp.]MDG2179416.1 glycosyltransferase family 4 protein [Algibacter sp.]